MGTGKKTVLDSFNSFVSSWDTLWYTSVPDVSVFLVVRARDGHHG